MIVVKFLKHWGQYNPGETAGFTAAELSERINVGSGPESTQRIPRHCYEASSDEAKGQLEQLFGTPAAPSPAAAAPSSPATPPEAAPADQADPATPDAPTS